mgnify:CR=1 FL=1
MYRSLTTKEIEQLQQQACTAKDWTIIEVAEHFDAHYVRDTHFSGHNRLGVFNKETIETYKDFFENYLQNILTNNILSVIMLK